MTCGGDKMSLYELLYPCRLQPTFQQGFEYLDRNQINNDERGNNTLENDLAFNMWTPGTEQSNSILSNLYKSGLPEGQVGIPENKYYTMNDLGKFVAGKDGKISQKELATLDIDKDNIISQAEYAAKIREMEQINNNIDGVFKGKSLLDKNGDKALDSLVYANKNPFFGPNEFAELNKGTQGVLTNNLYDLVGQSLSGNTYKMNDFGNYIAGEDGQVTAKDIVTLDTNQDGQISQEEINVKKAEMSEVQPPQLDNELIQMLIMMLMSLFSDGGALYGGFNQTSAPQVPGTYNIPGVGTYSFSAMRGGTSGSMKPLDGIGY